MIIDNSLIPYNSNTCSIFHLSNVSLMIVDFQLKKYICIYIFRISDEDPRPFYKGVPPGVSTCVSVQGSGLIPRLHTLRDVDIESAAS